MQKSAQFITFRQTYPEFHYYAYHLSEDASHIFLRYDFAIPGLAEFHPALTIPKKSFAWRSLHSSLAETLAFHIGLVELISYWKTTCSPRVIIHCGHLDSAQIAWWKKLYFYGLGELFYTNDIKTTMADFMQIEFFESETIKNDSETISSKSEIIPENSEKYSGYIVLVGGGKDSIVTLETLSLDRERDCCLIVNPKPVTRECVKLAGFDDQHLFEVYRTIDPALLKLNSEGFINGHTPFSTLLAFVSYFIAYLASKKYIVVSNESSANESNLACSCDPELAAAKINHQYSKSFEFESDFDSYVKTYFQTPIQYFSFLRPLNELQIAKIFARLKKYHPVFKSCNVGSKGETWVWCGHCSKCLFAFTILSPYLYPDELIRIFGHDLFADETLLTTFLELTGHGTNKPFDCVGTFEEVNYALSLTIKNLQQAAQPLPFLLQYYLDHFGLVDLSSDLTARFNHENFLTPDQISDLRAEVFRNV